MVKKIKIVRELKWCSFVIGSEVTLDEINQEIYKLEQRKTIENNKNSALKVILNSIYGVVGFKSFVAYNKDVASAVTAMSRTILKFTIKIFNDYFKLYWSKDKKVHQHLGLTKPQQNLEKEVVNYADTDSIMMCLEDVYKNSGYEGNKIDFYLAIWNISLKPYSNIMFEKLLIKYGCFLKRPNGSFSLKLAMEQINENVLWIAKKKYIKNPIWDDGVIKQSLQDIQAKGIEINQSAYPQFIRDKLKEMIIWIMSQGVKLNKTELTKKLKSIKEEFKVVDITQISEIKRLNNYEKWVIQDTKEIKYNSGCPQHVKASIHYNYKLYNSEFKGKYTFLKSGVKVQYFLSENKNFEVFAFPVGQYPYEFSIQVDYDEQFKKTFLNPLNNILEVLGIQNVKPDIVIFDSVF